MRDITQINDGHAQFDKHQIIENEVTNEKLEIQSIMFDPTLQDIVYKCSHFRFKFDMVTIPEAVLEKNTDNGKMKVIDK